MVEKVDVPVDETPKESQEYIDKMVEKADQNSPAAQPQSEEENKMRSEHAKTTRELCGKDSRGPLVRGASGATYMEI